MTDCDATSVSFCHRWPSIVLVLAYIRLSLFYMLYYLHVWDSQTHRNNKEKALSKRHLFRSVACTAFHLSSASYPSKKAMSSSTRPVPAANGELSPEWQANSTINRASNSF